ncbi:MAG: threonine--tRNA ligase [Polyangiaceae bacterium]|nr:threonine--tRNA ligase [Polyangiaceae bacterium]
MKQTAKEILVAKGKLDKDIVAILVGDKVMDIHTPIEEGTDFKVIRANDPKGLEVIRHSTAHVMADAVQKLFPGTKVTIGPAIEDGFFYDFDKPGGAFSDDDLAQIETAMREVVAADSLFRREATTRAKAMELFRGIGETYKLEILERIPENEEISLYKHGKEGAEWFDLCSGPHVPSTGFLKAVKLTSVAGAYWRGDERNPMLQRIYGTAFSSPKDLEAHLKRIEEAKARDHRKLGKELDLFMFDPIAPAMPFFLPKGAFVYNQLVGYVRQLYAKYDYDEVITPQAFDPKLFRTSGHLGNYNENMFRLWTEDAFEADGGVQKKLLELRKDIESGKIKLEVPAGATAEERHAIEMQKIFGDVSFALKPMNCPSHCVIFGSRRRSYRELPWRMADFGRLHRYERGGVVHGLSRVRTFCQDDAHVFCTRDQVSSEIESFIKLLYEVYNTFKFERIDIKLATRPEKRIGSDADWDQSESALREGLEKAGLSFEIAEGEGAFYGPKVEFHVHDALKRSWQLGTIQYDPNLPERFDLEYTGSDGAAHRPVMLHRAILGSLERFFSVYLEHCGGNFPTWVSPKQALVITVTEAANEYAHRVVKEMRARGIRVDLDDGADKLGAKVRNGRLSRVPYICVVGAKEAETTSVGLRSRDEGELGAKPLEEVIQRILRESNPISVA